MEPEAVNGEIDPLDDVPPEHIPSMLSQMRNNFPEAVHAHEYVRSLLKYKKMKPDMEMAILAPGGDYRLGIIFFNVHKAGFTGSIYCHNEEAKKSMQDALSVTKKIPPSKEMALFSCLSSRSYEVVKPLVDGEGWSCQGGLVFWLPWYCARQLVVHIPEGVEIQKLSPEHADQIDEVWPHKFPGSRDMLAEQISVNFGLGVFRGDALLSWVILFNYGGIGAVQTVEDEKRKGYGRAVVEAMTKKLGEMQIDVHLNVVEGNEAGEAFFRKSLKNTGDIISFVQMYQRLRTWWENFRSGRKSRNYILTCQVVVPSSLGKQQP